MFDLSNPVATHKTNTHTLGVISDAQEMVNVASATGPNGESGYGVRFLGTSDSYAIINDPDNRISPNLKMASYHYWYFHMRPLQGHSGTVFSMLGITSTDELIGIFTVTYDGGTALSVEWRKDANSPSQTCSFYGCIKPNVWNHLSNSFPLVEVYFLLYVFVSVIIHNNPHFKLYTDAKLCSNVSSQCSNFANSNYGDVRLDRGIIFGTDVTRTDHWQGDLAGFTLRFPLQLTSTTSMLPTSRYIKTTVLERYIEDGPVQSMFDA